MSKITTPKPETLTAYLSINDRRATRHVYLETREVNVDGPAWEHIYKCEETGAERRWGLVDRLVFSITEEAN